MRNLQEFSKFRQYWRNSPEFPPENIGNNRVVIPVNVSYESQGGARVKHFASQLRSYIGAGPEDGVINLDEVPGVTVDHFHLTFNPDFQTYRYDEVTHDLVISGKSEKMSGAYRVVVSPTLSDPPKSG